MMTIQEMSVYNLKGHPGNGPALEAFIEEYLQSNEHVTITEWITEHLKGAEYTGLAIMTNGAARQKWKGGVFGGKTQYNIVKQAYKDRPVELAAVMDSFMSLIRSQVISSGNSASDSGKKSSNVGKEFLKFIEGRYQNNWQFSGFANWFVFFVSLSVHPYGIGDTIVQVMKDVNGSEKKKEKYDGHMRKKFTEEFKPIVATLLKHGLSQAEIIDMVNVELIKSIQGT